MGTNRHFDSTALSAASTGSDGGGTLLSPPPLAETDTESRSGHRRRNWSCLLLVTLRCGGQDQSFRGVVGEWFEAVLRL